MYELTVIGGGPGDAAYLLPVAKTAIEAADIVIADQRFMSQISHPGLRPMGKIMETIEEIKTLIQTCKVAVVVSGDPLFYSLYKTIKKYVPEADIHVLPGIGSIQMLALRAGETLEDACILSSHGRHLSEGTLAMQVSTHEKVCLFCDAIHGPSWMAKVMLSYDLCDVKMIVASNLSYENEMVITGSPKDLIDYEFDSLCVVMILNPLPKIIEKKPLLCDDDFIRTKVPMTKEEVRWTIIGKLRLKPDAIVWDVGAGTGSISVECARQCPYGKVYAIERHEEAIELIQKNAKKFQLNHLSVHHGMASEVIKSLEKPTHVFIGGSGKEMKEILDYIQGLGAGITIMAACVTLETISETIQWMKKIDKDFNMIQMNVGRSRVLGNYHVLENNNPVSILWVTTK